jgi:hypothetical protein
VIRTIKLLLASAILLLGTRSLSAKFVPDPNTSPLTNRPPRVHWRTITIHPGPHPPKIHFYDRLNPIWWFKNADEPTPPRWYRPVDKHRRLKWSFRNPLHNFDCYVIGVADKKCRRSGRFPDKNSDPRGGWDFDATRYKFIWLPFIAYHRPKFDFYFGWRNHGNFGIKININPKRKPAADSPAAMPDAGTAARFPSKDPAE